MQLNGSKKGSQVTAMGKRILSKVANLSIYQFFNGFLKEVAHAE